MPTDLFSSTTLSTVDPDKDYYEELVGPGKKYADQKAFARSRIEADIHIARLEDEQKRLRDELTTRLDYANFLDQLKKSPIAPAAITLPPETKEPTGTTTEDIERLLDQKMQQREEARSAEHNLNIVDAKLTEVLGPNYVQALTKQASELGVTQQFIKNLAAANPKALYRLLGIDEKPKSDNFFQAPPRNEFNLPGKPSTVRGDSYYENIRKTNLNLYWTPKIQNELHNAVERMGVEEFNKH